MAGAAGSFADARWAYAIWKRRSVTTSALNTRGTPRSATITSASPHARRKMGPRQEGSARLELAFEVDDRSGQAMILDSLGDLRMLRGELEDARSLLERAVVLAIENGNEWYAGQAKRTLGRCHLAAGDVERALDIGREALALAERIGDRQAICESNLMLAEASLRKGELEECSSLLRKCWT